VHAVVHIVMDQSERSKQPNLTIPYWNYADDALRPDWVWKPPEVSRGKTGDIGGSLPSQSTVDDLVNNTLTFTKFTDNGLNPAGGVEYKAHNDVHNWCNGTISSPPDAAQDPIFWLLHANVDRMWDLWQLKHSGTPDLSGKDAIMDPWPQTAADVHDIVLLGYSYG
jgi:hypothetical protein